MPRTAKARSFKRNHELLMGASPTDAEIQQVLSVPASAWALDPMYPIIRNSLNELLALRQERAEQGGR